MCNLDEGREEKLNRDIKTYHKFSSKMILESLYGLNLNDIYQIYSSTPFTLAFSYPHVEKSIEKRSLVE